MLAKDIMTESPIAATELMSVDEALALLYETDIRHLPVVRNGELVGIVSDRDLRAFAATTDDEAQEAVAKSRGATIGSFMNTSPIKADPETPVRELVEAMLLHRVGAVPIADIETGELLGIVSYVDLLRLLQETLD